MGYIVPGEGQIEDLYVDDSWLVEQYAYAGVRLWTWGSNQYGQLGDNTVTISPIQTIAGGTNWKSVACGYAHTAAITINNINTTGVE